MRSPGPSYDLRAALSEEIRGALVELDNSAAKPKAVHRCRLCIKRARALARVGRACAPGLSAVFNDSARAVMRTLASARDLTALADTARHIAEDCPKKTAAALEAIAENLESARAMLPPLNREGVRAGLKDLLALAQVWPEASARQIRKGAERVARRARCARRRGQGSTEPARRHDWRKREKERFYAVTLLEDAWPDDRAQRRKTSEKLGEVLGAERDALLLITHVEDASSVAGKPAKRALAELKRRRARLGADADKLGARLHAGGA